MIITSDQQNTITSLFSKMESKTDFLELLNYAKTMIYQEETVPFEVPQLNYYINYNKQKKSPYTSFTIKKKSGADRTIHAPVKGLKEFQKALNIILQCVFEPHKAATGFVIGKSIVDNAKTHCKQNYVYNIDLKDFFPSIDKSRVWGRLLSSPFNLNASEDRKKIANMIAALCCAKMKVERLVDNNWISNIHADVLPQGAPTSPILTNAICERLDIRLSGLAKRFGLNYTRYADDITFSSLHNTYLNDKKETEHIFSKNTTFDVELRRIINDQKFHIKESKVRLQKQGYRQEVTGLSVNKKVNVHRKYTKQLRQWLYEWESKGYEKAYQFFIQKYSAEKGHVKKGQPNMVMVLDGKLLFLKMVKGEKDATYLKLKERFDKLSEQDKKEMTLQINNHNANTIDQIFVMGLDEAMLNYNI
jgi:RNA-directed DNA polymerase